MARPVPPPLPGRGVPPPLPSRPQPPLRPGERVGEYDQTPGVFRQHSRDVEFLTTGDVFDVWIAVNSTWLMKVMFKRYRKKDAGGVPTTEYEPSGLGRMWIEFVSGAVCRYENFKANDYLDLVTSSSKGRYVYYQLKQTKYPYVLENGPTRSAAEIQRIVKAREPQTQYQKRRYYNVAGKRNAAGGTPSR